MNEKELAEHVIKKIRDGYVYFAGTPETISFFQKEFKDISFEGDEKQVKLRGYNKLYDLYFIKKDEKFRLASNEMVKFAGGNFETLLGFLLEDESRVLHIHVYYIGSGFDFDKMSEMIYSLFTETGKNYIKKTQETFII